MTAPASYIGQPLLRVDGHLKVRGAATYAAEFQVPELAYAVKVVSTIARGRIAALNVTQAEAAPGVLAVLTHQNAPTLPYLEHRGAIDPAVGERLHVLQDDRVHFNGQPVAVVVAETLEQAENAATLVGLTYATEPADLELAARRDWATAPDGRFQEQSTYPMDYVRGDPERALQAADVHVEQEYRVARENHNPMEPHATIARWDGERLTLWDKNQWVTNARDEIAAVFGLPVDNVRVISPFVGGAFGSTLRTWPHVTLAALAASHVHRPVKLVLSRRQMFSGTGCRPETSQVVSLGATRQGQLTGIVHEAIAETSTYEQYVEATLNATRYLHACPNVRTRYRLAPLQIHTPTFMRAPGEASGVFALECALDELAYELALDPVELRLRNEPDRDDERNLPFSSRSTRECYRLAAERFGWSERSPRPRSMRDGRMHLGWGMATAVYPTVRNFGATAAARARLFADGSAVVETAVSDMGPGTYTSLTQVACDALKLPPERVRIALGDSSLPTAPPHGGSMTMASLGPAVQAACLEVRARALQARAGWDSIEAVAAPVVGDEQSRFSMYAFGAVFAEVAVDADLGQTQVRRIVGAYGAGRIVNPTLARSQAIGGMVGGIGMALMEHTVFDRQNGHVLSANLAEYLVPVNADIRKLDVIFVEESDPYVNPLGVKGLGEIAYVGVAPAIANAVYHATGRRIRQLPITPDLLLSPW